MPRQRKQRPAAPNFPPQAEKRPSTKKRAWDSDVQVGAPDFFSGQYDDAEARNGPGGTLVGTEAERVVIGIPLRAFSLQHLYCSDTYPLGRMEMHIGESDSCKTAFLFEKMRWFLREEGGGSVYLLNEARDPSDLRTSICTRELLDRGGFRLEGPCESLEDWQRRLTKKWLHRFEEAFKRKGGCAFPVLLGLDSITGTTNEGAIKNIDEEGCAKLTFGQDANLLNQYAKYLFQRLYRWPFSFVCTNHIKFGQDRYGNKVMRIPGGDELRYVSTYITHLKKVRNIDRLDVKGGRRLVLSTLKSMGDHREILVDFVWWFNGQEQVSVWDWHAATVELLSGFTGDRKKEVEEIITFPVLNKQSRTCTCPAAGIKKPEKYDAVGKAIMQTPALLSALQNYFGVKRRRAFVPHVPYDQQIAQAIEAGSTSRHDMNDIEGVERDADDAPETPTEVPEK